MIQGNLPEVLEQDERMNNMQPAEAFADWGYKGIKQYKETIIQVPGQTIIFQNKTQQT